MLSIHLKNFKKLFEVLLFVKNTWGKEKCSSVLLCKNI